MIRAIPNRHLLVIRFERILADRQRRPRYLHSKRASPPYLRVLGNFVPSRTLIALHLIVERKACFCRRGRFLPNLDPKCVETLANRRVDCKNSKRAKPLGNPWRRLRINVSQSLLRPSQAGELIGRRALGVDRVQHEPGSLASYRVLVKPESAHGVRRRWLTDCG